MAAEQEKELTAEEATDLARDILTPSWRHADKSDDDAIDALAAEEDS